MNYAAENENEKTKEAKKTSEEDSYEDYENEAMESDQEGFGAEDISLPGSDLPFYTCPPPRRSTAPRPQEDVEGADSFEERQKRLLREKWLTVTGRKPRNIPNVKRQDLDTIARAVHFGDRRPADVEKKIRKHWLMAAKRVKTLVPNYGRVQREVNLPALCDGILCIRFDPQGDTMTTAYRNGGTQVRKAFTGEVIQKLVTKEEAVNMPIRSVRYHPMDNEILYIGGGCGTLQVYNINSPDCIKSNRHGVSQINCLDISSDGSHLVVGGRKGIISVYDAETLEVKSVREFPQQDETTLAKVEDEYHKMKVYGLKCHPTEPTIFVTGSWDSTVKVWDVRVQGAIKSIRGPTVYGDGVDVMGDVIATASWRAENSLSLWDLPSGKLIKNIPIDSRTTVFEGEFLYAVKIFRDPPDGELPNSTCIAVGGSGFSSMMVINTVTEKAIAAFPTYKAILSLDLYGNFVAYGGKESLFRIGDVVVTGPKSKRGH